MFAYSGWQTSSFMAGEMRESNRSLPIGIIVGVIGVIVLYLAMNAVCLYVLGAARLASTMTPGVGYRPSGRGTDRRKDHGEHRRALDARLYCQSNPDLAACVLSNGGRRHILQATRLDQPLDARAGHRDCRAGCSRVAIALPGPERYNLILNWVTSIDYVFFGFSALAIFIFRRRDRIAGAPEPWFAIPLHPWSTLLFLVAAWGIVVDVVLKSPIDASFGIAVLLLTGIPIYYAFRRMRAGRSAAHLTAALPGPGQRFSPR